MNAQLNLSPSPPPPSSSTLNASNVFTPETEMNTNFASVSSSANSVNLNSILDVFFF